MENATLARPYAKAAFRFALQQAQLDVWSEWLVQLSLTVQQPKIHRLLNHPGVSADVLLQAFSGVMQLTVEDKRTNFLRLLIQRRRLILLPDIAAIFNQLKAAREQVQTVCVTTTAPLADSLKDRLLQALKIRLGCEVMLEQQIDQSLLGGAVLRAGDLVIDGSVRGKLQKLKEQLLT